MNESERTRWLRADERTMLDACDVHTYRASGPGGQKRNKTDSAVRLRHRPTDLTVVATESRSQHENRARALRRLRLRIALSVRETVAAERVDWPDGLADYFGRDGQFRVNARNPDYVYIVAGILDALHANRGRLADTARSVGISTGQLTRFLTVDGKLHAAVNQLRVIHGQRPLRSAGS